VNFKKVANYYLDTIMKAGAVGVQIRIGGKLGGEKARSQKFKNGLMLHSGDYAETLVDKGQAQAMLKPGIVGIEVKIMKTHPSEVSFIATEEKEYKAEKEIVKKEGKVGDSQNQADKGHEA
jgi:small subunit ribosomal protein S3